MQFSVIDCKGYNERNIGAVEGWGGENVFLLYIILHPKSVFILRPFV